MTENTKESKSSTENEKSDENSSSGTVTQQLVDLGSSVTKTPHGTIHCLTIVGQIEGHMLANQGAKTTKYEHVMPLLTALEQNDDIAGVLFLLNTVGGDVEAGLGIAELIAGMRKPTVSLVLGGSHSIGVPLAVAAKASYAVPSAAMTIHPVRMSGTVIAAPQTYNYFDRLQERIVEFVVKNSHISKKKFLELMLKTGEMAADVGSVLYGQEAVSVGLIDHVGGLSDALDDLYDQIDQKKAEKEHEQK
ncbi:MAG: ATP-dependent Clp protease proteolytic subunit [Oscillibacter sp.]|jgi:ATP-dependent protease ClpP protease subunit|nr:ATP-dependent Clp protease proteolytic subunit [Oscillibacter sp.]